MNMPVLVTGKNRAYSSHIIFICIEIEMYVDDCEFLFFRGYLKMMNSGRCMSLCYENVRMIKTPFP